MGVLLHRESGVFLSGGYPGMRPSNAGSAPMISHDSTTKRSRQYHCAASSLHRLRAGLGTWRDGARGGALVVEVTGHAHDRTSISRLERTYVRRRCQHDRTGKWREGRPARHEDVEMQLPGCEPRGFHAVGMAERVTERAAEGALDRQGRTPKTRRLARRSERDDVGHAKCLRARFAGTGGRHQLDELLGIGSGGDVPETRSSTGAQPASPCSRERARWDTTRTRRPVVGPDRGCRLCDVQEVALIHGAGDVPRHGGSGRAVGDHRRSRGPARQSGDVDRRRDGQLGEGDGGADEGIVSTVVAEVWPSSA